MNTPPKGWASIPTLNSFEQISTNNKKVKTKECFESGLYPVIDQGQSEVAGFFNDSEKVIHVKEPLIIFGDHTRIIKWVNQNFIPGADGTKVLKPKAFLNNRFAYFQLKALEIPDRGYSRHFQFLKELPFFIAPLNEQLRIASKLDRLLAKVDAVQSSLKKIPILLQRFRRSVLTAATSGELTKEWREFYGVDSFEESTIRKCILDMIGGASPRKNDYVSKGMLALNKGDIKSFGKLAIKSAANYVPKEFYGKHHNKIISNGDIVVTLRDLSQKADFLGLISKYLGNEQALITQGMYAITPNPDLLIGDYLILFSNSSIYREQVKREKVGATQVHLRNDQFLNISIPLPAVSEQKEIVRRVESLFALADRVERSYNEAKENVDRLTQSLLAKAFRGELVPQDPNDESAFELLKRIHVEHEAKNSDNVISIENIRKDESLESLDKPQIEIASSNISNRKKKYPTSVENIILEKINETSEGEEIELDILLGSLNYPYEELKKALFNLTKGDLNSSLKPKAVLYWDGVYKIGMAK